MTNIHKITKLIEKLEILAKQLDREWSLEIHYRINQFHYLEKAAELRLLYDQYHGVETKRYQLIDRMECEYKKAYYQWKKDIRWMNSIQRKGFKSTP